MPPPSCPPPPQPLAVGHPCWRCIPLEMALLPQWRGLSTDGLFQPGWAPTGLGPCVTLVLSRTLWNREINCFSACLMCLLGTSKAHAFHCPPSSGGSPGFSRLEQSQYHHEDQGRQPYGVAVASAHFKRAAGAHLLPPKQTKAALGASKPPPFQPSCGSPPVSFAGC